MMEISEKVREPALRIGAGLRSCKIGWFFARANEVEQLESQVERFKEEVGKLKHHLSPEGEYSITRSDGEPMSWESLVVSDIFVKLDELLENQKEN